MSNINLLSGFFNERIRVVDGKTKPLLQKLKSVCEARAVGRISEDQAVLKINSIMGWSNNTPVLSMGFSKPVVSPFVGVRTNHKKEKAIMEGLFDFNNKPRVEQFPILGLKPINNNSKKKKFIVAPMSRTWFDVKDFKQPKKVSVWDKVKVNRVNESNKAMNNMFKTAMNNSSNQSVLKGMTTHIYPRKGKRKFKGSQKSVAEMMGVKF